MQTELRDQGFTPAAVVARALEVNIATVYRWISASKVEGLSVGGRHYVRWATVLKHLGKDAVAALGLKNEPPE